VASGRGKAWTVARGGEISEQADGVKQQVANQAEGGTVPGAGGRRPPAVVDRPALLQRLRGAAELSTVAVLAPAGYGKTTLLRQWDAADRRAFAWVSCQSLPPDPGPVIARLSRAFRQLPAEVISHSGLRFEAEAVVPDARTPIRPGRSFVIVFDDFHVVDTPEVGAALRPLVDLLPAGSLVVISSRREPAHHLGLAHLEVEGRLARLGPADLAVSVPDAARIFEAAGASITRPELRSLVDETGGWPAALSFAARHHDRRGFDTLVVLDDDDTQRVLRDYVRDEIIRPLPDELADFLQQCSILERMSGPLCDATLGTDDARRKLESLTRDHLLLAPIGDGTQACWALPLVQSTFHADLRGRPGQPEVTLHQRASEFLEANGDPARALHHARRAHDLQRVASLLWSLHPPRVAPDASLDVNTLLSGLRDDEIGADPRLAVLAAWYGLINGDAEACERWTTASDLLLQSHPVPRDPSVESALLLIRAATATDLETMRSNAERAYVGGRPDRSVRAAACTLSGAALRLGADAEGARRRLEEGVEVGMLAAPGHEMACRAQLALLAVAEGAWSQAAHHVQRIARVLDRDLLVQKPALAGIYAVAALVDAHTNTTGRAQSEAKSARELLDGLVDLVPSMAIEARIILAEAYVLLGNIGRAHELVDQADSLIETSSNFGGLDIRAEAVRQQLGRADLPLGIIATPLTPAEARVLRYLPTHLTFAEIADELFVSRNTVKTQAIAAYRKLGVTSRREAVDRSRSLGLVP
jgi:LuxR family maltose regulon positive regulatory protein